MTLGDKIHELRKINGMSQEFLAEKMNVSRQSISKWENGQSAPSSDNLFRMAEIFNVPAEQLKHPNTRIELVMEVRKELVTMKNNSKIMVLVVLFAILFIAAIAIAIYGRITGNIDEQTVLYLIIMAVAFMLVAFLPIVFIILQYVYKDCKSRGIKPTFWVLISTTVIGLVYYLMRRDELPSVFDRKR